ncbi:MAG: SCO family protein [Streptosporangiaceae bacterium]|nr:SCO family protein [Streptosporangiaceae bacterium]
MPGMSPGLNITDPTLVAAFRSALLQQFAVVAAILVLLLLAYGVARRWRAAGEPPAPRPRLVPLTEPRARRFLRLSFGILWIIDGILQAQPQMAGGLPSEVVQPSAAASPTWVQHVVNAGGTIWSFHPIQAAAASVWIQVGIGVWLVVAEVGWWSRLGGLASVAWGLVVWVFGESFGGIFAPGLTWLMGAPGAVLLYITAGAMVALPVRAWAGPRAGRLLLAAIGTFWIGMAVLQAWPGRGFWQNNADGTLTGLISNMAGLVQPHPQETMINGMVTFTRDYGFAVNLVAVIALAASGAALLGGATVLRDRPAVLRVAVPASIAFCLVVWVLVQDLGVPGGLGTDPNSMVPWALLVWAGYQSARSPERSLGSPEPVRSSRAGPRQAVLRPAMVGSALRQTMTLATARSVTSLGAVGVVLVGAGPLAMAATNWHADPIIARAMGGAATQVNRPAPDFRLVSQSGQPVSLASLRGKVTLLTFLDPRCITDCPVATELKEAGVLLGGSDDQVRFVAIVANQFHYDLTTVRALDRQEGMDTVPNWLFLTGSAAQLEQAWGAYGIFVSHMTPHASSVMRDLVFVIDKSGRIRQQIPDNPMAGTLSTRSSFAVTLADAAQQALSLPDPVP